MKNSTNSYPSAPPEAERGDDFTQTTTFMIAGKRCVIEPVFKKREQTPETVGSILLKLMLEKA